MSEDGCAEMRLLIQADVDGELTAADAARVAAHLDGCAGCTDAQARLLALGVRLRQEVPRHAAPAALRAAVRASIGTMLPPAPRRRAEWRRMLRPGIAFGAGAALAAGVLLAVLPSGGGDLADAVVASHVRALQPGHLMDVVSTDQHTVKPWFNGRLDFSPPVKDLAPEGFPLAGGRLDYLAGRPVAALVYKRRQHMIDLFVWPASGGVADAPGHGGYNVAHWQQDGMVFWAVSDVSAGELAEFVRLWKAS
jgi:anti-sigma factor RsiW